MTKTLPNHLQDEMAWKKEVRQSGGGGGCDWTDQFHQNALSRAAIEAFVSNHPEAYTLSNMQALSYGNCRLHTHNAARGTLDLTVRPKARQEEIIGKWTGGKQGDMPLPCWLL